MSTINKEDNSKVIKKNSSTSDESSYLILKWLFAVVVPIIVLIIVYCFFRATYNYFFFNMDQDFILGALLWLPTTTIVSLITLYALLPKFKFGITLATCLAIFILNTVSAIENLLLWSGFSVSGTLSNILSNILIYLITIYLPVYFYKRNNKTPEK